MNPSRFSSSIAVAALSVGLTACGGSGGGAALSKTALIAKVNSICASAQSAAKAVPAPTSFQDPAVAAGYFDKIAPITDKETQDLRALKPAGDVQSDYAGLTSAQLQANTLLQTIKRKADAKDPSGLQDLKKISGTAQQVVEAANKLGATTCAQ